MITKKAMKYLRKIYSKHISTYCSPATLFDVSTDKLQIYGKVRQVRNAHFVIWKANNLMNALIRLSFKW